MNFWDYRAKKANIDKAPDDSLTIPELKLEELEARPEPITVEEKPVSDTFIGKLDARIRKLWGGE
jgi:hypothetical protein